MRTLTVFGAASFLLIVWYALTHEPQHVVAPVYHAAKVTESSSVVGTTAKPATETQMTQELADREANLEARIHQLRVAEISGGFSENLSEAFLKGPVDIEKQIWAANTAADKLDYPGLDVYSKQILKEGAADFEKKLRAMTAQK